MRSSRLKNRSRVGPGDASTIENYSKQVKISFQFSYTWKTSLMGPFGSSLVKQSPKIKFLSSVNYFVIYNAFGPHTYRSFLHAPFFLEFWKIAHLRVSWRTRYFWTNSFCTRNSISQKIVRDRPPLLSLWIFKLIKSPIEHQLLTHC